MARGTSTTRGTRKGGADKHGTAGEGTAYEPTSGTTARSRLRAGRGARDTQGAAPVSEAAASTTDEPLIPEHVARFFAALPTVTHPMQWILQFRKALLNVLPDVDRISMSVSMDMNRVRKDETAPVQIIQALIQKPQSRAIKTRVGRQGRGHQYEAFIQQMAVAEDGFKNYHAPIGFDLFLDEERYLASIVLLRDRTKPAISVATVQTVDALRPFLAYAISGMALGFSRRRPTHYFFRQLSRYIIRETYLTAREVSVLALQYYGYTYEQIADTLHISPATVQQRIKSMHRKTGCTTYLELFGRYVVPELLAAEEAGAERVRVVTVM